MQFSELKEGDKFDYGTYGNRFLKIEKVARLKSMTYNEEYNAVRVYDGVLIYFGDYEGIIEVSKYEDRDD